MDTAPEEMDTHIIVADDHPLFRDAVTHLLARTVPAARVSQVDSFRDLQEYLAREPLPSLVLLDLKLSDTRGLDGLLLLKKEHPSLPILIISAFDDDKVVQMAMQSGASGFVPKRLEMERMAEAIQAVLAGDMWFPELADGEESTQLDTSALLESLTPTQLRVLSLLRDGMPSKEMAAVMSVTEATIKAHLTEIFRKLKVKNRTQAVLATRDLDLPSGGLPD